MVLINGMGGADEILGLADATVVLVDTLGSEAVGGLLDSPRLGKTFDLILMNLDMVIVNWSR